MGPRGTRFQHFQSEELDLALLLAIESWKVEETVEARGGLRSILVCAPEVLTFLPAGNDATIDMAVGQEDSTLFACTSRGQLSLWDLVSHELRASFEGDPGLEVRKVAPSRRRDLLAVAGNCELSGEEATPASEDVEPTPTSIEKAEA